MAPLIENPLEIFYSSIENVQVYLYSGKSHTVQPISFHDCYIIIMKFTVIEIIL